MLLYPRLNCGIRYINDPHLCLYVRRRENSIVLVRVNMDLDNASQLRFWEDIEPVQERKRHQRWSEEEHTLNPNNAYRKIKRNREGTYSSVDDEAEVEEFLKKFLMTGDQMRTYRFSTIVPPRLRAMITCYGPSILLANLRQTRIRRDRDYNPPQTIDTKVEWKIIPHEYLTIIELHVEAYLLDIVSERPIRLPIDVKDRRLVSIIPMEKEPNKVRLAFANEHDRKTFVSDVFNGKVRRLDDGSDIRDDGAKLFLIRHTMMIPLT